MAANPTKGIFIIGAKRTPFCKYGGSLRDLPAAHAFAAAAKNAMQEAHIAPHIVDNTIVGNVFYLSQCDGGKNARYCGLYSGVPIERPALGVNKACGSGIQAIITSAVEILTGLSKVTLTGGTEIMSSLPLLVRNVRFGSSLGQSLQLEDHIRTQFVVKETGLTLERIAENVALKYGISREDADEFAWNSHLKWNAAKQANAFHSEITPVTVKDKKKEFSVQLDETPAVVSLDDLKSLKPILDDGSIVTEGNFSLPADGASALLLCDEASCHQHQLRPMARLTAWAVVGAGFDELGAVAAVRKMVGGTGTKLADVDLFEINENSASQTLATIQELGINPGKVNLSGGALCFGNPVAATGARMVTHLVHLIRNKNLKKCIAASSCGGDQGVAVMLEQP